jgi:hypothetical protein
MHPHEIVMLNQADLGEYIRNESSIDTNELG